ncbi:gag/pol protein [Cucumis melo var. makuwa]|uniref:Gag/pol protein n=1 Tax=Cucumis melo var. makuwa TaxID=1194695 RepID=A0A5D3BF24_CUCMM|nr:gag/pol protein [Cucumis melo var. makuwa]
MTKRSFTGKGLKAKTPLELVHSDLCGPMNVKARGGYEYFISFIDDYSRYDHVYLIQNKSDSFETLKEYKAEVENESGKTITTLRLDRSGGYMDLRFQDYLIEHGIQSQLSTPNTPKQKGVSEGRNRTLLDMGVKEVYVTLGFGDVQQKYWCKTLTGPSKLPPLTIRRSFAAGHVKIRLLPTPPAHQPSIPPTNAARSVAANATP